MLNGTMEDFCAGSGGWGVVPLEAAARTHGAGDDIASYITLPIENPFEFLAGFRDGFLAALRS